MNELRVRVVTSGKEMTKLPLFSAKVHGKKNIKIAIVCIKTDNADAGWALASTRAIQLLSIRCKFHKFVSFQISSTHSIY